MTRDKVWTYSQDLETKSDIGLTLAFSWWGGAYIEVALDGHTASEVVNVWDYATDTPRIPRTQRALNAKCREWVREYPECDLVHDVCENW